MQIDESTIRKLLSRDFTNAVIRIGLIAFLVLMCVRVFAPFINLVLWAVILAIALYPLHQLLARWIGGRQGIAAVAEVEGRVTRDPQIGKTAYADGTEL